MHVYACLPYYVWLHHAERSLCLLLLADGYLYVDEALRIIRVYSQVHQVRGALNVDRLWQQYRDCSVLHEDGLLIHTQDALHCLSDCL